MANLLKTNFRRGSLIETVSTSLFINSGGTFKQTESGLALLLPVGQSLLYDSELIGIKGIQLYAKGSGTLRITLGATVVDILIDSDSITLYPKNVATITAATITFECIAGSIYLVEAILLDIDLIIEDTVLQELFNFPTDFSVVPSKVPNIITPGILDATLESSNSFLGDSTNSINLSTSLDVNNDFTFIVKTKHRLGNLRITPLNTIGNPLDFALQYRGDGYSRLQLWINGSQTGSNSGFAYLFKTDFNTFALKKTGNLYEGFINGVLVLSKTSSYAVVNSQQLFGYDSSNNLGTYELALFSEAIPTIELEAVDYDSFEGIRNLAIANLATSSYFPLSEGGVGTKVYDIISGVELDKTINANVLLTDKVLYNEKHGCESYTNGVIVPLSYLNVSLNKIVAGGSSLGVAIQDGKSKLNNEVLLNNSITGLTFYDNPVNYSQIQSSSFEFTQSTNAISNLKVSEKPIDTSYSKGALAEAKKHFLPDTSSNGLVFKDNVQYEPADGTIIHPRGWNLGTGTFKVVEQALVLNSNLILNGGSSETTDWVDSNLDGLADNWVKSALCVATIVTGNGFVGNVQRITTQASSQYVTPQFVLKAGSSYKIKGKYRADVGLKISFSGILPLPIFPANMGDAIEFETEVFSRAAAYQVRFNSNEVGYLELDEIEIIEIQVLDTGARMYECVNSGTISTQLKYLDELLISITFNIGAGFVNYTDTLENALIDNAWLSYVGNQLVVDLVSGNKFGNIKITGNNVEDIPPGNIPPTTPPIPTPPVGAEIFYWYGTGTNWTMPTNASGEFVFSKESEYLKVTRPSLGGNGNYAIIQSDTLYAAGSGKKLHMIYELVSSSGLYADIDASIRTTPDPTGGADVNARILHSDIVPAGLITAESPGVTIGTVGYAPSILIANSNEILEFRIYAVYYLEP